MLVWFQGYGEWGFGREERTIEGSSAPTSLLGCWTFQSGLRSLVLLLVLLVVLLVVLLLVLLLVLFLLRYLCF